MYQSVRGKKRMSYFDGLNIGGGFPIKNSLAFEYDYQYMIDEIINQIKIACDEAEVDVPNILLNLVPLL
jgi:arginine decarboxylase